MKSIQDQKTVNSWFVFFAGNVVFMLGCFLDAMPVFSMPREKEERPTEKMFSQDGETGSPWDSYISEGDTTEGDMKGTVKYRPNNRFNNENDQNAGNLINRLTSPKPFNKKSQKSPQYCFTRHLKEGETPYFPTFRNPLDDQTTLKEEEKKGKRVFKSPPVFEKIQYVQCERHRQLEQRKEKERFDDFGSRDSFIGKYLPCERYQKEEESKTSEKVHFSQSSDPLKKNPIFEGPDFQRHQEISDVIQTLERKHSLPSKTNIFEEFH